MNWYKLLLSCAGRIDRKSFLIGLLPVLALLALLFGYGRFIAGMVSATTDWVVMGLIALEALYFLVCLAMKRLRDIGRPPAFIALFSSPLIFAALFLVQQKFFPLGNYEVAAAVYTLLIMLALIAFFWMLLEMLFRRSRTEG